MGRLLRASAAPAPAEQEAAARAHQTAHVRRRPIHPGNCDFMAKALSSGQHFTTFNVIDEFNHEVLRIEADTSLPAASVIEALN